MKVKLTWLLMTVGSLVLFLGPMNGCGLRGDPIPYVQTHKDQDHSQKKDVKGTEAASRDSTQQEVKKQP